MRHLKTNKKLTLAGIPFFKGHQFFHDARQVPWKKKQAKRMPEIGLWLFYATHFNPHTRVEGQIE
jgi:hypothetical protein